ncbi:MAG: recombinase family protein [Elusimicrobiaceae bacterium]|jgi:site-specific DNA recombinase|nr:recombinase family protein [Elusimicrobiaceae bacterium]MBT4008823.1 recombinase family protein [Elusimicrobiaceae bacterium]MBT5987276.1 recombinase family protein [Elusimicrobiaceae bacterium]
MNNNSISKNKEIRCAIYARKSSEKGLEQKFNSLHNQEEACKAYITSQAFNNWTHYKTYEDGGISGGTMKRSGLQQMLKDIKAHKINIVVVYKVDRLSRSILDFHNMMKEFSKYDVDFVSITQSFDTSNSMGKLTLNMLLSFAQFEREVGSERTRDKIRASKAKGLWTGGRRILGYDVVDKKLVVNLEEAEIVKNIFKQYLIVSSLEELKRWCRQQNYLKKKWKTSTGKMLGGTLFGIECLRTMFNNKLYIGKVEHKGLKTIYKGVHEPIISKELWDDVHAKLHQHFTKNLIRKKYERSIHLLNNNFYHKDGQVFKFKHSKKNAKRFNYYGIASCFLPAEQVDKRVIESIAQNLKIVTDKELISKVVYSKKENISRLDIFINFEVLSKKYPNKTDRDFRGLNFTNDKKHIVLREEFIIDNLNSTKLSGTGRNLLDISEINESLIRAISYGWRYRKMWESGMKIEDIERQESRTHRTIYKYLNLSYLSPKIIDDIFTGKNPKNLNLQDLFKLADKEMSFNKQEIIFYNN